MKIQDTMKINELLPILFNLDKEKIYDVLIQEHKEKRSLNANAYFWQLCNKLGNAMKISKEEVYLEMLRKYGQSEIVSVQANIDVKGYFQYYREIGKGNVGNKEFKHYKIFRGSSTYDTREMAILIDGIVSECQDLGIETMTTSELERMKSLWQSQ